MRSEYAVLASRNGRRSHAKTPKTPSLCAVAADMVGRTRLELFAELEVLGLDVTLDRLVGKEEYSVGEARSGKRDGEAWVVRTQVANPGIGRELWTSSTIQTLLLVARLCGVEREELEVVSSVMKRYFEQDLQWQRRWLHK